MTAPLRALTNAVIFTGEAFVETHALLLQDGKVLDIVGNGHIPPGAERQDCRDTILAPGLIDCQVNGGGGVLFNNQPTAEGAIAIAKAHAKWGTTRLLPTFITDTEAATRQAITAARQARSAYPGIIGLHLDGPHISSERRGVHQSENIRPLHAEALSLYQAETGEIFLMTLAPEQVAPEAIRRLRSQNVIVSLGHTQASGPAVGAALAAGATGFTHLYNAMGAISARAPGPAGIALDDRDSWCGIICDGHHVTPEMIRLAYRAKPPGKLFLVSDAMPPSATEDQPPFELYGERIYVAGKRCINAQGTLAGAALTLAENLQHCIQKAGIPPEDALPMASANPAAFLGIDDRFGKLLPGFTADIVAFNPAFSPQAVWRAGEKIA